MNAVRFLEPTRANKVLFGKFGSPPWLHSWPSNSLKLHEFDIYTALKVADPQLLQWKANTIDLQRRHLEQIDLRGARLGKIDLSYADLSGAMFDHAKMQGARLDGARLVGATFRQTQLQGASFSAAQLQTSNFERAQLQGARFSQAQIQGAILDRAVLHGVSFEKASLHGASLVAAQLQGSWLANVELPGATLDSAQLQGAYLWGAQLHGASLRYTQLLGASLGSVGIEGALFDNTFLWRSTWDDIYEKQVHDFEMTQIEWRPFVYDADSGSIPWSAADYIALREKIENIPEGEGRQRALKLIARLDCSSPDVTLDPCGSHKNVQENLLKWQQFLSKYRVQVESDLLKLAEVLERRVCIY